MREAPPTRYLYIVGRGYSGSTILSLLMGEPANIASVGEIITGFRPGFETKTCANGEAFSTSPFWAAARTAFERRAGRAFAAGVGQLNRRAHSAQLPASLLAASASPSVAERRHLTQALYDGIAEAARRPVVLDSSKELSTAIVLLRHLPAARLIHMVRSPFGVVDSYVKRVKTTKTFHLFRLEFKVERFYFMPMVVSALLWSVESLICEALRLVHPKRMITIHYEDLCEQPVAVLERLERFTGLSLAEAKTAAVERRALQPSHALSGNRLMRNRRVIFSPKLDPPRHLTQFDQAVVTLCTFPMALAYGYFGGRAGRAAGIHQVARPDR